MTKRKTKRGARANARRGTARAWISNPASQLAMAFGEAEKPRAKIIGPRGEALHGVTPAAAKKEAEVIQLFGPSNFDEADSGLSRRSVAQYARHRGGSRAYGPMTEGQAKYAARKAKAKKKAKPKKRAAKRAPAKPKKRTAAQRSASAKKAARTRAANAAAKAARRKPVAAKKKKTTKAKAKTKSKAKRSKAKRKTSTALATVPRVHTAQLVVAKARPYAKNKARKPFGRKKGWLALPVAGTIYSPIRGVAMRNPNVPAVLKESAKIIAGCAAGSYAAYALGQASNKIASPYVQFAALAAAAVAAVGVSTVAGLPAAGIAVGVLSGGQLVGLAQSIANNAKMSGLLSGLVQRPALSGLVQRGPAINGLVNAPVGAMPSERNREDARRVDPPLSRVGSIFQRQTALRQAGY